LSKAIIKNRKAQNIVGKIFKIAAALCAVGCIGTIIYTQATISEKKQELAELNAKAEQIQEANDEYQRLLDNEDVNAYMETLAIENMSYAYPNEIRFFDTSRN